jgi:type VI protein secretion system component VasA
MIHIPIKGVGVDLESPRYRVVVKRRRASNFEIYELHLSSGKPEMIQLVVSILDSEFPNFLEKLRKDDKLEYRSNNRRTRRYVGKNRRNVGGRTVSIENYHIITDLSDMGTKKFIRRMCEITGVRFYENVNVDVR